MITKKDVKFEYEWFKNVFNEIECVLTEKITNFEYYEFDSSDFKNSSVSYENEILTIFYENGKMCIPIERFFEIKERFIKAIHIRNMLYKEKVEKKKKQLYGSKKAIKKQLEYTQKTLQYVEKIKIVEPDHQTSMVRLDRTGQKENRI